MNSTTLTINAKVEEIWANVFQNVNSVINHTKVFSRTEMGHLPSPSVAEILKTLKFFDHVINLLLDNAELFELDYDCIRLLLNCRVQVTNMESLAVAIDANNDADYELALGRLQQQAPF